MELDSVMELTKEQLIAIATDARAGSIIGGFLPNRCDYKAFADLDGTHAREYLESKGFKVVENKDVGTNGIAITSCGIYLSTNGFICKPLQIQLEGDE